MSKFFLVASAFSTSATPRDASTGPRRIGLQWSHWKEETASSGGEVEPSTWGLFDVYTMWRFPEMGWNGGTPKSSILIGSIRNQPPMHNVVIFYILGIVMKYEKYWKMLPDTHIWWYMIQGTCLCLLVIKKEWGSSSTNYSNYRTHG
jgi:hypothetical protein